jgi:hypothetical protein
MAWRNWQGKQVEQAIIGAQSRSIKQGLDEVLRHSRAEVPFDTGRLSQSGGVFQDANNPLIFSISFGGGPGTGFAQVPYAVRWHETEANFQQGRKKNYLRDPLNQQFERAYKAAIRQNAI